MRILKFVQIKKKNIYIFKVCDYYVHDACQEFAVPSCVEKATYDATKTLCDARNATTHHFQVSANAIKLQ